MRSSFPLPACYGKPSNRMPSHFLCLPESSCSFGFCLLHLRWTLTLGQLRLMTMTGTSYLLRGLFAFVLRMEREKGCEWGFSFLFNAACLGLSSSEPVRSCSTPYALSLGRLPRQGYGWQCMWSIWEGIFSLSCGWLGFSRWFLFFHLITFTDLENMKREYV